MNDFPTHAAECNADVLRWSCMLWNAMLASPYCRGITKQVARSQKCQRWKRRCKNWASVERASLFPRQDTACHTGLCPISVKPNSSLAAVSIFHSNNSHWLLKKKSSCCFWVDCWKGGRFGRTRWRRRWPFEKSLSKIWLFLLFCHSEFKKKGDFCWKKLSKISTWLVRFVETEHCHRFCKGSMHRVKQMMRRTTFLSDSVAIYRPSSVAWKDCICFDNDACGIIIQTIPSLIGDKLDWDWTKCRCGPFHGQQQLIYPELRKRDSTKEGTGRVKVQKARKQKCPSCLGDAFLTPTDGGGGKNYTETRVNSRDFWGQQFTVLNHALREHALHQTTSWWLQGPPADAVGPSAIQQGSPPSQPKHKTWSKWKQKLT